MAARCKLLKAILTFLALLAASVASSRGQTPPKPTYSWVTLVPQGSTPSPVAEGLCWTQTDGMHCYYSGAAHGPFLATGGTVALTVGGTTIGSGTTGRVLYDNGGLLGELTDTQLTTHINAFTTSLKGRHRPAVAAPPTTCGPMALGRRLLAPAPAPSPRRAHRRRAI
jgi:hypothetical protein